jgi:Tol biopolymer transport system component/DNA-binding winged helix-turn-helix (wHTH) protein
MSDSSNKIFEFGPFRLDSAEQVLLRNGQPVPLDLKAFDVLLLLVENSGHIVEKNTFMNRVWAGSFVEENNLKVAVSKLRKVLEDNQDGNHFIETVPRRGYRFVAGVKGVTAERVDLVMHERTRETVTIDQVATVHDLPPAEPQRHAHSRRENTSQRKLAVAAAGVLVLGLSIAAIFLGLKYVWPKLTATRSSPPFENFKINPLTTSARTEDAAISPDGKFVAYLSVDGANRNLWMRHISTGSDTKVAGPPNVQIAHLTFSPNGDYLYYLAEGEEKDGSNWLYQMPVLGGTPRKLINDIDSAVTLSPDGKQLAFLRGYPAQQQACVMVANSDGTGERKLATHHLGELFLIGPNALGPAWSPDGEMIAFAFNDSHRGAAGASLMTVRVKDGVEKRIVSGPWQTVGRIIWLRDGRGLIFIAAELGSERNGQIWHVSYPGGELRRITNDLFDYKNLSLSADSTALVTVQNQQTSSLWTTSNGFDDAAQISSSKSDALDGLSWTTDGRVVYVSRANGQSQIWISNADGTDRKQLTFDSNPKNRLSVSPDGRYIVFASVRAGTSHIWRMDIGGGNEMQLSRGSRNTSPQVTFDSRWVVYNSFDTGQPTLWKVPIAGGEPAQLTDYESPLLAMSPQDGRILYDYVERNEQGQPRRRFAIIPLEGGAPGKTLDFIIPGRTMKWAPEGGALTYAETRGGVSNIWSQPIDGSAPRQLTNFKSHRIFRHDWSSDGKRLALARGTWTSDAVLIRDLANTR